MITDSNQKLQIEEAKKCLLAFKERLTEVELAKDNGIIFSAQCVCRRRKLSIRLFLPGF